jgi:hypothetical protein
MARRVLILFFIISGFPVTESHSQILSSDSRLRQIISQFGQAEVSVPYDGNISIELLTKNVSILSVRDKTIFISLSPVTVDWFIGRKFNYTIIEKLIPKGLVTATDITRVMDWDVYPTYTQYDSIMQSFHKNYPSLCRLDTIGKSINGQLVLALRITADNSVTDKPKAFYTSSMHGDETGGYILMLHLADYLLKNYLTSPRINTLLNNLEIWINPLANPDGTYRNDNTINSATRYNANGFDLNRNFPDPLNPNTFKQKETLDMIKFLRKHRFALSANFHSGTEVVNYPWDRYLTRLHADDAWFYAISRAYADTVHKYSSPAYMNFMDNGVTRGADWYLVYGGRQDFVTSELQGREVTIELDDQYITPPAQLTLLWQNNWRSLIGYLENALHGIHGSVRNVNTNVPVPAKVFINGYDKDSSHVYCDTLTGGFARFLPPGSWNVTFSANGYISQTVNNIVVTEGQKTELTVELVPVVSSIDPLINSPVLMYPVPAKDHLSALLPDEIAGEVNVKIYNQTGMLLSDYYLNVSKETPFDIDLISIPEGMYFVVFRNTVNGLSYHGKIVVAR